jgi:rRNA maturation RNase YbeY
VLSISVVDASEMAELNSRYRNKEGPTNVLAFPQNPGTADGPGVHLLGDVVICGDRVAIDAEELGYTQQDMLLYLLIHGALHLMGHQHDKADRADAMARRVEQLFATLREHPEPDSVSRDS